MVESSKSGLRKFDCVKYALVITVDSYAGLRSQDYPGFDDIPETRNDR